MSDPYSSIVVMGFGNIGQALASMLRMRFMKTRIVVIDEQMHATQIAIASHYGFDWLRRRITPGNYIATLAPYLGAQTLYLNLATSIGSRDVIAWTQAVGADYLDTCIDPWEYQDGVTHSAENTNYAMRETVLALAHTARLAGSAPRASALVAHGANPGFVSILVKEGLLRMQQRFLPNHAMPENQTDWATLACALGIRVIQISEKDTQSCMRPRAPGEFVNTWSVDGYVAEALQPAELGWGTHEESGPLAASVGRHASGCQAAVYIREMGVRCSVKSWAPRAGNFIGNLISHNEAISLADYLTLHNAQGAPCYRPTAYYAYHPSMDAHHSLQLLANGDRSQISSTRVMKDEIDSGIDELGVWLLSDRFDGLWIGSQLSIARAREMAPHNNATSLQVVGSIMAGIEYMVASAPLGIVESEQLNHAFLFQHAKPYWEPLASVFHAWHPSGERGVAAPWTLDQFLSIQQPGESVGAAPAAAHAQAKAEAEADLGLVQ